LILGSDLHDGERNEFRVVFLFGGWVVVVGWEEEVEEELGGLESHLGS